MKIYNGVFTNLSNEEYHADKNSISRSALMDFDKSGYTYWAKHLNPDRPKKDATKQMELGTAFHTLILEPAIFEKTYVVKPNPVFLKHDGREAYEAYKKLLVYFETCGSIILSVDEWDNLMAMKAAL